MDVEFARKEERTSLAEGIAGSIKDLGFKNNISGELQVTVLSKLYKVPGTLWSVLLLVHFTDESAVSER